MPRGHANKTAEQKEQSKHVLKINSSIPFVVHKKKEKEMANIKSMFFNEVELRRAEIIEVVYCVPIFN